MKNKKKRSGRLQHEPTGPEFINGEYNRVRNVELVRLAASHEHMCKKCDKEWRCREKKCPVKTLFAICEQCLETVQDV